MEFERIGGASALEGLKGCQGSGIGGLNTGRAGGCRAKNEERNFPKPIIQFIHFLYKLY